MKMLIAEIGVNWNSIDEFEVMLSRLANIGIKYAKGQIFTNAYKAIEKHPSLINNVLSFEQARHLMDYAKQLGITLFWTPSEDAAVDTVIALKPEFIKIAHTHCMNRDMLGKVNKSGIPLIVSVPHQFSVDIGGESAMWLACVNDYPPDRSTLRAFDYNVFFNRDYSGVSLHSSYLTPHIESALCLADIIEVHVKQNDDCIDSCVSISIEEMAILKRELDFIWGE